MLTVVTLARHAEFFPYKKEEPKYPGPGLTPRGKRQALRLARSLQPLQYDMILCSDMTRALETAAAVSRFQKHKPHSFHELAEHNKGIYENQKNEGTTANIVRAKKTLHFFKHILRKNEEKKILIVAHGNVFRAILGWCLGHKLQKSFNFNHDFCGTSTLIFKKQKLISIVSVNDHKNGKRLAKMINWNIKH